MRTVWIYVDTDYEAGHPDHLKVFLDPDAADEWFAANDLEGVVFGYEIEDSQAAVESRTPDHELITKALREARAIVAGYLEPGHVENAALNRLVEVLDTQELAAALERQGPRA